MANSPLKYVITAPAEIGVSAIGSLKSVVFWVIEQGGNCSSTLQGDTVVTIFLVTIQSDRKLADTLLNETVVTDDAG